ncbi:MAG: KdsC family phosphatase [Thermaurantimonas sp.]
MEKNYKEILSEISTFVFDIDGVLTDGRIQILPDGRAVRNMTTHDSFAIQLAIKRGLRVAVISGGSGLGVSEILRHLGVVDLYLNTPIKIHAYEDLKACYQLNDYEICYMGDDLPDYEVMSRVRLAVCPHNAAPEIRAISDYVSPKTGGNGCVRDILEQTLRVRGWWNDTQSRAW